MWVWVCDVLTDPTSAANLLLNGVGRDRVITRAGWEGEKNSRMEQKACPGRVSGVGGSAGNNQRSQHPIVFGSC